MILAVIDGLGPELLDRAIAAGRAPTIERLQSLGSRTDACVSTFPSLTPVCLAALVTGQHPAGSRIPSMTWYHRDERRIVEYGSSFAATLAEGTRQMLEDVLVNLNLVHLSHSADTVFETLEDAGLVTAAVNCYVCRGRVRHPITRPSARKLARRLGIVDAVYGPRRYFFGELFASDHTGAPRNFGGSRRPPQRARRPLAGHPRRVRLPVPLPLRDRRRPASRRATCSARWSGPTRASG